MGNVKASVIAAYLNTDLSGEDFIINSVSSLSNPKANSLVFSKKPFNLLLVGLVVLILTVQA